MTQLFAEGKFVIDAQVEQICDTLDIPCPENVTFDGSRTIKTGEIYYEGNNLGKIYNFKITDEQLSYMQDGNNDD